jgi:hypothetical protein
LFSRGGSSSCSGSLDLFGGVIVEGPHEWTVRPVAEAFLEREFGGASVLSGLAGAIWQPREGPSFDVGLRVAGMDDGSAFEIRAGLTWATSLWGSR